MITKDPAWKLIVEQLKNMRSSEKILNQVMKQIPTLERQLSPGAAAHPNNFQPGGTDNK